MLELFSDPQGGFFDTANDQSSLIIRPKDIHDNATPSGNALAANALLHLSAFTGNEDWRVKAEEVIGALQGTAANYPHSFAYWLSNLDFALGPVQQIALVAPPGDLRLQSFTDVVWHAYNPNRVVAVGIYPPEAGAPALLRDRGLIHGSPTAYLCEQFTCQLPATSPDELRTQLEIGRKENSIRPD